MRYTRQTTLTYGKIIYKAIFFVFSTQKLSNLEIRTRQTTLTYMPYLYPAHPSSGVPRSCAESSIVLNDTFSSPLLLTLNTPSSFSSSSSSPSGRKRSTAGPVSYTWVARSRSESTSQFTALALNKPSSSFSSSSCISLLAATTEEHSEAKAELMDPRTQEVIALTNGRDTHPKKTSSRNACSPKYPTASLV